MFKIALLIRLLLIKFIFILVDVNILKISILLFNPFTQSINRFLQASNTID